MQFQYLTPFPVRFRDVDMLGHVNNAVYLSYLEVARVDTWAEWFGPDGWARMPFLVGDAYVRYLAPIPLRTRVELGIRFASIGNKSFVLEYQVRNADTGQVMAEARTTQVMVDNEGRTYPVPDEVRRKAAELGVPDAWPKAPGA
jgi:acyl-CoA thioester hydrolase